MLELLLNFSALALIWLGIAHSSKGTTMIDVFWAFVGLLVAYALWQVLSSERHQ